jgi:phenylalanyl-tRNA synthetase beta chain
MAYKARPSKTSSDLIDVDIPPTRADILHQVDIMEDVAIAYGFNELPRSFPSKSGTIAQPLPVNKLTDIIRMEAAMAGWSEVLPLILCSHDENFAWLNRKDDGNTAVKLANPKTLEFQVVRTSLLPGLLKTLKENRNHSVPMKIFEVSDVAFKDLSLERKSRNERHFAAAWYGKTSGFEVVHGLLDRVMAMLKSAFITGEEGLENTAVNDSRYWIEELDGTLMTLYDRNQISPLTWQQQIPLISLATPPQFMSISVERNRLLVPSVFSIQQFWRTTSLSYLSAPLS